MSDLLRLTARLRAEPDERLVALVQQRHINTANLRDLFDLGEQLLSTRNLQATIASLPASKLDALEQMAGSGLPNDRSPQVSHDLAELQLAFESDGKWHTYEAVAETLRSLRDSKAKPKQKPSLVLLSERQEASTFSLTLDATRAALSQDEIDRDCGIAMFETMQALTELVFLLEQHFVREVGRGNVGLPDLKRLASRLNKTTDYSREIFDLASMANICVLRDGRWQKGSAAAGWMAANLQERWAMLAEAWLHALGKTARTELIAALDDHEAGNELAEVLARLYPLADSSISANIKRTVDRGNLVGLTDSGLVASWTRQLLAQGVAGCAALIGKRLPEATDRIIVQADLSLIAPGPLTTATEIKIREFADCEQIGFASTYRISTLSITLGLEYGLTADGIREFLTDLSGKQLPQPVEYLLRESEERFGRLVVHEASVEGHSLVASSDPILLKGILNDPAMKPFGLAMTSDENLACSFEAEVLYFGLREAGYAAIRESVAELAKLARFALFDSLEELDEPRVTNETAAAGPLADIARMREQDSKPGINPDSDDVTRQIQLAIKNRVRLNITVSTSSGDSHEFLLEPTGIANGRLRAKDRKADIERTLPLSSITAVSLA